MNSNQQNTLLNCFICFQKVRQAKMCPYCSKIGCHECLKMWFSNSKMECPYCRQQVSFSAYANCGRFVDEIKDRLTINDQLKDKHYSGDEKSKSKDICVEHQIQMRYYCQTCKSPFCPDCSTFEDVHKGHKISLLSKIHQSQKDRIHQELNKFDSKTQQYRKNGSVMQAKFQELTQQKRVKKILLDNYLKERLEQLENEFRDKETIILAKIQTNEEERELLLNLQETIIGDLSKYSQNQMVTKSDQIVQLIGSFSSKTAYNLDIDTSFSTINELIPEFTCFTFELANISSLEYSIVYSGGYLLNGIEWKLKIYPKGNGPAKDRCISVFLEMTQAYESKKEYEYKIELVNQHNEMGSLTREYMSLFDIGECWGYNQFIDLQLLNSGFLLEDKLIFKFYVRPSDYKSQTADQQNYIGKLETQMKQLQKRARDKSQPTRMSQTDNKFNSLINDLSLKSAQTKNELSLNNLIQMSLTELEKEQIQEARIQHQEIPQWDN